MSSDLRYQLGALERSMHAVARDLLDVTAEPAIAGADKVGVEIDDQRTIGTEVFGRLYGDPAKIEAAAKTVAERVAEAVHKACSDTPEFETLRSQVERDPIASYSAMSMVLEGLPADVAEKAAQEREDETDDRAAAQRNRERAEAAAKLRAAIADKAADASETEREVRAVAAALGYSDSVGGMPPAESAKLRKMLENDVFRAAMDALGRMRAAFRRLSSQERVHGHGVPFDVELGGDLSRTTGSALAMLASDDEYGDHAMRALMDHRLPQYRLARRARRDRGPFVVLVDRSYSMTGNRWYDAMALSVAALQRAHATGRKVALVTFTDRPEPFDADFGSPSGRLDAYARLCAMTTGGGTQIAPALAHAGQLGAQTLGARCDILLLSDGEDGTIKSKPQVSALLGSSGLHYVHVGDASHNAILAESSVAFHKTRALDDDKIVLAAMTATDAG